VMSWFARTKSFKVFTPMVLPLVLAAFENFTKARDAVRIRIGYCKLRVYGVRNRSAC
jgi:hypothetical protein